MRSIFDAAESGTAPVQIVLAVRQALEQGLTTRRELLSVVDQRSQRVADLIHRGIEEMSVAKDADLVGPDDVEAATDDLIAAQTCDLGDHFVFAMRRIQEGDPSQPEPTISFHVTAQVAGAVFDEATVDVGFRDTTEWEPETVASDLLAFAGIEPTRIPVIPLEVQVAPPTFCRQPFLPRRQIGPVRTAPWHSRSTLTLIQPRGTGRFQRAWTPCWQVWR